MKIDIITLHNVKNYGSVLQSYATQKIFEDKGFDVEFINYYRENLIDENILKDNLKNSSFFSKNFLTRFLGRIFLPGTINKQIKVFNQFLKKYIKVTDQKYYTFEQLKNNVPKADLYCTGSDQMWNAEWNNGIERAFYLDFLPEESKRFAFSTSFGRESIENDEENKIYPMLKKYMAISVREKSGKKILDDMGIKNSVHLLDPTFMLTKEEWNKLIQTSINLKNKDFKYILVYQLNMKNKEFDEYVRVLSKEKKLPVIRVSINNYQKFKYGKLESTPDVLDFLDYFMKAEYIVTDSFHGTAFSINFNKKFICVFPKKFSERLNSILQLTNLKTRQFTDVTKISDIDNPIDYNKVNDILNKERNNANAYLDKVFQKCIE